MFKPASAAHVPRQPAPRTGGSPLMIPHRFPSREAIAAHQLPLLRKLLRDGGRGERFYAPRLEQAGLTGELGGPGRILPLYAASRGRRRSPRTSLRIRPTARTSPIRLPPTTASRRPAAPAARRSAGSIRPKAGSGCWTTGNRCFPPPTSSRATAVYFAFSFGPFLGFWTAFEAACQFGCRCLPGGGLSSLARLQAIRDNAADVLLLHAHLRLAPRPGRRRKRDRSRGAGRADDHRRRRAGRQRAGSPRQDCEAVAAGGGRSITTA